ncbi:MAG: hypothetical protein R3C60_06930 [Parvularculaceae bacterium]
MKILGETIITPEESYVYTGGASRIRLYMRIASVAVLGIAFVYVAGPVLVFFLPTAAAFFLEPRLWLGAVQPFPGAPALPAIFLVIIGLAISLLIAAAVIAMVIAPIGNMLTVRARRLAAARAVGLAGKATFELDDKAITVCNVTGLGERTIRFNWSAFDKADIKSNTIRLIRDDRVLVHLPLRSFSDGGVTAQKLIDEKIAER